MHLVRLQFTNLDFASSQKNKDDFCLLGCFRFLASMFILMVSNECTWRWRSDYVLNVWKNDEQKRLVRVCMCERHTKSIFPFFCERERERKKNIIFHFNPTKRKSFQKGNKGEYKRTIRYIFGLEVVVPFDSFCAGGDRVSIFNIFFSSYFLPLLFNSCLSI